MKKNKKKNFIYKPIVTLDIDTLNKTKNINYEIKKVEYFEEFDKFYIDNKCVYFKNEWYEYKMFAINIVKNEFQKIKSELLEDEQNSFDDWINNEKKLK